MSANRILKVKTVTSTSSKDTSYQAIDGEYALFPKSPIYLGKQGDVALAFGAGAPTVSLPANSLYIRTDASSISAWLYRATDATGTWAAKT